MSLLKRFYQDRFLHVKMLSGSLLFSGIMCVLLSNIRQPEFFEFHFQPWHLLLLPLALYLGGLSVIYIHNATHNSFPNILLNRFFGHLAGMHQLWGFSGWKLIHIIHHQYTDNADLDIHSPKGMTFGQYFLKMFYFPSQVISKRYYEHWGDTPKTRASRKFSFSLFLCLVLSNLYFWYLLLGPEGMVFFYIPSFFSAYYLFAHLNYFGHPVDAVTGETHPVNLNHNWYYKIANYIWHGIYYHENHHKRPLAFNPKYVSISQIEKEGYA